MAGKSIYFTRKELEGLRDFIKYLETDGKPDDEELYALVGKNRDGGRKDYRRV